MLVRRICPSGIYTFSDTCNYSTDWKPWLQQLLKKCRESGNYTIFPEDRVRGNYTIFPEDRVRGLTDGRKTQATEEGGSYRQVNWRGGWGLSTTSL
jgi:rRNA maturation protein Nop10